MNMQWAIWTVFILVALGGGVIATRGLWLSDPVPSGLPVGTSVDLDKHESPPEFKREYSVALSHGRTLKVTAETSMFGERDYEGEIDQPGGAWILFEPNEIADKVLDPALVPTVTEYVAQIIAADKIAIKNDVEFTDRDGRTWILKS